MKKTLLIGLLASLPMLAATIKLEITNPWLGAGDVVAIDVIAEGNSNDEAIQGFAFNVDVSDTSLLTFSGVTLDPLFVDLSLPGIALAGIPVDLFGPVGSPIRLATLMFMTTAASGAVTVSVVNDLSDLNQGLQIVNLADFSSRVDDVAASALLQPVPEPGALSLLLTGAMAVAAASLRRKPRP